MAVAFSSAKMPSVIGFNIATYPFVISKIDGGIERFYMMAWQYSGRYDPYQNGYAISFMWVEGGVAESEEIQIIKGVTSGSQVIQHSYNYITFYNNKLLDEAILVKITSSASYDTKSIVIESVQSNSFTLPYTSADGEGIDSYDTITNSVFASKTMVVLQINPDLSEIDVLTTIPNVKKEKVKIGVHLPPAAKVFRDAAAYLWGKDIFVIFVGTGILFSRNLTEGSFGYLDTSSVLGTITQYANLQYSQDEGTLYIVGQDTTNTIRAAKIVLNTLYDYANDGAWLPMIASDGIPAYIKAKEVGGA